MIYVTHEQVEALTTADRIVVLRDGRVEQVGTPMQLYDQPNSTFVAGFIGSPRMNPLTGDLARPFGAETIGIRPGQLDMAADGAWTGRVIHSEVLR